MHAILGLLGTAITVLVLLNRLSDLTIDLTSLNPFLWNRRRQWRKKYEGNPVFNVQEPMEVTAILMVAVAKADGDMVHEDKRLILSLFESTFKLSEKEAAELLLSSVHLLGDGAVFKQSLKRFLSPSKHNFTESQIASAISLLENIAENRSVLHPNTEALIQQFVLALQALRVIEEKW